MSATDNLQLVKDYLQAMETRTSFEDIEQYYHPDIQQVEYPNAITKNTAVRFFNDLKEASGRGQKVLSKETYEIINIHAVEDTVIAELVFRGTMAIEIGSLAIGDVMTAHFAQFFDFREGKIYRQRNYDCFLPF